MTTTQLTRPADTSMMRIVHDALRRDLDRLSEVLHEDSSPDEDRRTALGRHIDWMVVFLQRHHAGEDRGLFPVVGERRPDAAALLGDMDRDHRDVADAIDVVTSTVGSDRHLGTPESHAAVTAAVDRLREVLVPHLRREEDELLPIVAACMTHGEWSAIEQEHFVGSRSMYELGLEGHWLIDGADEADRATVVGVVPAVPRFVLLHGLARTYLRRRDAWWRPERLRRQIPHHLEVAVEVPAPVEAVWDVVRDPTRVGEWSDECIGAEYLDGATTAAVGTRFRGRNRQGLVRWGRVCELLEIEPHVLVWRTVPTAFTPDSSEWRIRLEPTEDGTRIEQRYDIVRGAGPLEAVYATILPQHRDRSEAIAADLHRLGEVAARGGAIGTRRIRSEDPTRPDAAERSEPVR